MALESGIIAMRWSTFVRPGETITARAYRVRCGGKGLNNPSRLGPGRGGGLPCRKSGAGTGNS